MINAAQENAITGFPVGTMQGRLTQSRGRGIQFFPFENWEEEFRAASAIGIEEIEFIFDEDRYVENPLWSAEGLGRIRELMDATGVRVRHICADFFMRRPFFRVDTKIREENIKILRRLIRAAHALSCAGIEIPLVDHSSIRTPEEEALLIDALRSCLPLAYELNIALGLEIDYPPQKFLRLLEEIKDPLVRANYDSGNSSGLGYDAREEMQTYGRFVSNVHIKDRELGGSTVALGTGNANFNQLFGGLREVGYRGSFILQVARGPDGKEVETVRDQATFVRSYIRKYLAVA